MPGSNNFQTLPRRKDFNDKGDVKIDDTVNSTPERLRARSASARRTISFPASIPGASGGAANGHVRIVNQQLTAAGTYTPSVSQLVEVRLGISRTKAGKTPIDFGAPGMLTGYGIPGIPEDPAFSGGLNTQTISGYTALGRQNSNPQHQDPLVINPRINYSKILSRHSLKLGYEHQAINTDIEDFHPKYGQDTYNGQFSRPAGRGSQQPLQPRRFSVRRARSVQHQQHHRDPVSPADALRLRAGRLESDAAA